MTTALKTRFCPSPTGLLHLGNIRTALFNFLLAKKQQGRFLLRIEDTDCLRSKVRYTDSLKKELICLGLYWDEGPEKPGQLGPYLQSQRQSIYDTYYQRLAARGLVYPCFCTQAELALSRKLQRAAKKPPRYSGTCAHLTPQAIADRQKSGLNPTLRFSVPKNQTIVFNDLVKGEQVFKSNDLGDFVIQRADKTAAFLYANAIDDALMHVTHVLRGEDHLTNTPRQLLLLQALGLESPAYGHIPLIISQAGAPLSKRGGSLSLCDLRAYGYMPLALLNYLARLGHHYTQDHWLSFSDLIAHFSVDHLRRAPAHFDTSSLLHWQHEAILRTSTQDLWQWMGEGVQKKVPEAQWETFVQLITPNIAFPKDAEKWAHYLYTTDWSFQADDLRVLQAAGAVFFETVLEALPSCDSDLKQLLTYVKHKLPHRGKALFQPLRLALTGTLKGPELAPIMHLLGEAQVASHMRHVLDCL